MVLRVSVYYVFALVCMCSNKIKKQKKFKFVLTFKDFSAKNWGKNTSNIVAAVFDKELTTTIVATILSER